MMVSPCYNLVEKQDCPNRSVYCRMYCYKWKKYEAARNREYKDKEKRRQLHDDLYGHTKGAAKRLRGRKHIG